MDNKRLIPAIIAAALMVFGYYGIVYLIDRAHPEWAQQVARQQEQKAESDNTPTTNPASSSTAPTTGASTTGASTTPTSGPSLTASNILHAVDAGPGDKTLTLGSDQYQDKRFAMQVTLDPHGAGIGQVMLNAFRQTVRAPDLYRFQEPYPDHPETQALATRSLSVDGTSIDTLGGWKLDHADDRSASFSQDLVLGDKPMLRLVKTYTLADIPSSAKQSQGYELSVVTSIKNLETRPVTVRQTINGPTVPPKEVERGADRQVLIGYRAADAIKPSQHVIDEFRGEKATQDLTKNNDGEAAAWSGTASAYFNALVLPVGEKDATPTGYQVRATNLDTSGDALKATVAVTLQSDELKLNAGQTATLPLSVFFGPKQRKLLDTPYYSALPREYNSTLVIVTGWCTYCTLPWLINALVAVLSAFHFVFRDWGIAIICLVAIVRILLHPITKRSQVHMMKMGKMGPEVERLKKKYGDDKDALNRAMMQLYKEQGLAPILGCLPMFLQTPIWIALWNALQSTFELRHSPFLYFFGVHFTWIRDLANPDALLRWPPFTVFGIEIGALNILPILLGAVFYLQQKYTPKPVATTPDQEQQQKMMMWMSTLMFPLFLYKGPAGLNLYILTSTTIGIIEGKVIRDHIKQREEAEKAGKVIVDARPTRGARRRDDREEPPKKPATGLAKWLSDLQAKAEQIRREADRGK